MRKGVLALIVEKARVVKIMVSRRYKRLAAIFYWCAFFALLSAEASGYL